MYLIYIAVLSWCVAACAASKVPKGLSKRIVTVTRLEKCKDAGLETWTCSVHLAKSGRKHLLNGNCTWPVDINESMKIRLLTSLFKDGQYHDGYLDVIIEGCKQIEHLTNGFLKAFFASTDIESNQCPYPKGTYVYKNFLMEGTPTMPNTVPNGLYKLSMYIIDGKENVLGCSQAEAIIKPDNRKGNN